MEDTIHLNVYQNANGTEKSSTMSFEDAMNFVSQDVNLGKTELKVAA